MGEEVEMRQGTRGIGGLKTGEATWRLGDSWQKSPKKKRIVGKGRPGKDGQTEEIRDQEECKPVRTAKRRTDRGPGGKLLKKEKKKSDPFSGPCREGGK